MTILLATVVSVFGQYKVDSMLALLIDQNSAILIGDAYGFPTRFHGRKDGPSTSMLLVTTPWLTVPVKIKPRLLLEAALKPTPGVKGAL